MNAVLKIDTKIRLPKRTPQKEQKTQINDLQPPHEQVWAHNLTTTNQEMT